MEITLTEAMTILDMFGYVHGEGGYTDEAGELVCKILAAFPELAEMTDDDGEPTYDYLRV